MFAQQVYQRMEEDFKKNIPQSLYWNYQELANNLGGTPQHWETLLDQPDQKRFIDIQLSKYLEIDARKALNKLADLDSLNSSDVTALTRIIENSKLLQQKHQSREHVIFSYLPMKEINHHADTLPKPDMS